jgi:hypothetical protein
MIKKSLFVNAIFISILTVMTVVPEVMGDTVEVYRKSGYFSGVGGEFTLKIINNNAVPDLNSNWALYNSNTRDIGTHDPSFQSFCVEKNEYVETDGHAYAAVLNDKAIYGGNYPNGDPLSVGTAWLYHEFQSGGLTGYDYTGSGRATDAGALQDTIWWLEGEANNPNNFYSQLIVDATHFGSAAAAKADNFQNGDRQIPVMVLNLWDPGHVGDFNYRHQDQLVCVPPTEAPEPATLLLLGSGLIGLAGFARKKFRK